MNKNGLLISLSESDNTDFGKKDFSDQSQPQMIFSAIWEVESEVNNGGFKQYFSNNSAESAHFVVEALDAVGAQKTADICKRAISVGFPGGLPKAVEEIQSAADDFSDATLDRLSQLDREFFAYPHNLTDLLFDVSAHPEEFGTLPHD